MILITARNSVTAIDRAEQLPIQDWLQLVYYNEQAARQNPQQIQHSEKFYRTHTRLLEEVPEALQDVVIIPMLIALQNLEEEIDDFMNTYPCEDMSIHYDQFFIPKHSGGMREINAPKEYLKTLMDDIKKVFETNLRIQYHDRAYAYFKGRGTKDALIVHQNNHSKWFLKLDLKDFFPSCNSTFIKAQLQKLFPFQVLYEHPDAARCLDKVLALSLLNNGLPQGTPLSPMLTNLIMLPIDFALVKTLSNYNLTHFEYTRYADDLLISCKYDFAWRNIQTEIAEELIRQDAPFRIKQEKTRYGSSAGRNWNLGLMLNKDNQISLGHKQKERLRAGINNFLRDFTNSNLWSTIDLQRLLGNLSYLKNIEPAYCAYIIQEAEHKYNLNWDNCIHVILN